MKTIFFDLDGTLLPMDLKEFEQAYFGGLCKTFPQVPKELLIKGIWTGTKAMVLNDGSVTNREAFAKAFNELNILDYESNEDVFLKFYETDFQDCVKVCSPTPISREIVDTLKSKGYNIVIATNPLFPQIATYSRLKWLNMSADEFLRVTTFENSGHAKPNPAYYLEICEKLNLDPKECIMIGNDVTEDGVARKVGMDVILVTDDLINKDNLPLDDYTTMTLAGVLDWAKSL